MVDITFWQEWLNTQELKCSLEAKNLQNIYEKLLSEGYEENKLIKELKYSYLNLAGKLKWEEI